MATMQSPPNVFAISSLAEPLSEPSKASVEAPEIAPDKPAANWRERIAQRVGRSNLKLLFLKRKAITSELRQIPRRMQLVTNQARLVLELVDDFRVGTYRDVSWMSIAVGAAGLVYAVSPADVVPDALPLLGALDDMVVLTLAMRFLQKDLRSYCRFKGYDEVEYFGSAKDPLRR